MNTRKILLVSADRDLTGVIKVSALTLTKLNCQISIDEVNKFKEAVELSQAVNLDLIVIDNDIQGIDTLELLKEIRKNHDSKNKKIIVLYSGPVKRKEVFNAGCDSIMSKEEFKRVVNNVLVF